MVSTLTERGADATLRALELGAVDFVAKPKLGVADGLRRLADDIADKIRIAATAKLRKPSLPLTAGHMPMPPSRAERFAPGKLVFVGASTGGTEATRELLANLPADCPPRLLERLRSGAAPAPGRSQESTTKTAPADR